MLTPINFQKWIDENRQFLKPPVGNKLIWEDSQFLCFVVGGPNARHDYHFNEGEEFFYQVEGDITVKIIENGKQRDVQIKQGEIFLLPARTPHSPQRGPNTIGLVIERKRLEHEKDGLLWFCPKCGDKLYEEYFHLTNIVSQFKPVFDRFYSDDKKCTCKKCGIKLEPKKVS